MLAEPRLQAIAIVFLNASASPCSKVVNEARRSRRVSSSPAWERTSWQMGLAPCILGLGVARNSNAGACSDEQFTASSPAVPHYTGRPSCDRREAVLEDAPEPVRQPRRKLNTWCVLQTRKHGNLKMVSGYKQALGC